ncbi:PREDICTED: coiled-coil domain-containing protein 103 [Thamnophis sirtalis]|uniref:Coiled-coil domain-containing protein 103 n=1 Tax=Thamnophis sirtalis TaxID=35019 RepID=A0A6I9Z7Z5_9SAUR|nr:PREDICTED: coiled-coil domain-containing protein 103 [Thamnophis sirtalis]
MIDFHALEKELEEAIATDEKYQRENEAKFRAVHQKVSSYEEFRLFLHSVCRDIVLASHLKPLEKKDKMECGRNVLWNSCAVKANHKQESKIDLPQELESLPETSAEFYRDWRRCMKNNQDRYLLLLQLGAQNLGRIFQTDLAFGLLGEFLVVLNQNASIKDCNFILDILENLSGTKRFGLNIELLSEKEKENCRQLFEKLQKIENDLGNFSEIQEIPDEDGTDATQIHCQGRKGIGKKVLKLMNLYQISLINS